MNQQNFDGFKRGVEVGIGADDGRREGRWKRVSETEDGKDHREAKEDETEPTDGGDNLITVKLGILKLRSGEKVVELLLLVPAEGELDVMLFESNL